MEREWEEPKLFSGVIMVNHRSEGVIESSGGGLFHILPPLAGKLRPGQNVLFVPIKAPGKNLAIKIQPYRRRYPD